MAEEVKTINEELIKEFGEKSKDADELIAHTLTAIKNMQRGALEDILYKIMTKGNPALGIPQKERYIHRSVPGLPTEERREGQYHNLRREIEQYPAFPDTVSREEGMERVSSRKNWIMRALGY